MATITFTPYGSKDGAAMLRTCRYIVDGHGDPPYAALNQYIADGHGGSLYAKGYYVAPDAELAALQMKTYKAKYKKNHPVTKGTNAKKKDVDVVQMYISLDGTEKLGQSELMRITDELIRRTDLSEFPILAAPHYNTEHTHIHLVVCAYNITGTKKLAMNNDKLYRLRRTMDYICVEHNLSIVDPEYGLLKDPEYRAFYENVIENQLVPVIPRIQKKKRSRRKRSMQIAMEKQTIQKQLEEERKAEEKKKQRSKKNYFTYPGAVLPYSGKPVAVYKYDKSGNERSLLELLLILLYMLASSYGGVERQMPVENIYHEQCRQEYLSKTDTVAQRAVDAIVLSRKYQLTTEAQIQEKKRAVGKQINYCQSMIYQQQKLLEENEAQLEQGYVSEEDYQNALYKKTIYQQRLECQEKHLKELKREYRDLSWLGATIQRKQFDQELASIRAIRNMQAVHLQEAREVPEIKKKQRERQLER